MSSEKASGQQRSNLQSVVLAAGLFVAAHPVGVVLSVAGLVAAVTFGGVQFIAPPIIWSLMGIAGAVLGKDSLPGRAVRPADEVQLTALIMRVADELEFSAPLSVRVVPTVDAALAPVKIRGSRAYGVLLGWPLLRFLPANELAAVIAHELAHEQHTQDWALGLLLDARAQLTDSLDHRIRVPRAVAMHLLEVTREDAWRPELAADADAARIAGRAAVAGALHGVELLSVAFDVAGVEWLEMLEEREQYPTDFYPALEHAMADPVIASRFRRLLEQDATYGQPTGATHPELAQRLAAISAAAGPAPESAELPTAPLRLETAADLERWCVEMLSDPEFQPVEVMTLTSDELVPPVDRAIAALQEATGTGSTVAALTHALARVEDGSWRHLAAAVDPDLRAAPSDVRPRAEIGVLASLLSGVLAHQLAAAGWTRTSRWTTTHVTSPAGDPVDVWLVVEASLSTGALVELRRLVVLATHVST